MILRPPPTVPRTGKWFRTKYYKYFNKIPLTERLWNLAIIKLNNRNFQPSVNIGISNTFVISFSSKNHFLDSPQSCQPRWSWYFHWFLVNLCPVHQETGWTATLVKVLNCWNRFGKSYFSESSVLATTVNNWRKF